MKDVLLIAGIIMLVIYFALMIVSFIWVKKSKNNRVKKVRDKLLKYINLAMILTVILMIIIIVRVIWFK